MIRPPFMARVAAGMAVTAYEETLKLPSTAVALPMTTVSQILQTTMRIQQAMTSLAIKGDQLFEVLGAPPAEKPEWAVFDDDAPTTGRGSASDSASAKSASTPGRFALYSIPPETEAGAGSGTSASTITGETVITEEPLTTAAVPAKKSAKKAAASKPGAKKSDAKKSAPEIAEYLDYDSLTLAQLRARLRTLSVEDLTALLDYENANAARTPFVTMLSNRITSARGK